MQPPKARNLSREADEAGRHDDSTRDPVATSEQDDAEADT
jgi:hypothetical protein